MNNNPTINNLVKKIIETGQKTTNVLLPATIESYDHKLQKASVQIGIKQITEDGQVLAYQPISGVPVVFPAAGGASITMPVNRGDRCLVFFFDRDVSDWLNSSTGDTKPKLSRWHSLTDAVAIMGLKPFVEAGRAENNTDVLVTYAGSHLRLKPGGKIDIHSATEIDVKTNKVIINCTNAIINADENIKVTATKDINVTAEKVNVECTNAKVTAKKDITATCETANLTATNNINVISIAGKLILNAETGIDIVANSNVNINSTSEGNVIIDSAKNVTINSSDAMNFTNKNALIKSTQSLKIECATAEIKASTSVTIDSPNAKFTGNGEFAGNLKVAQNITGQATLQVAGTTSLSGNLTVNGSSVLQALNTSSLTTPTALIGAVNFSTHLHPVAGAITGPPNPV